MIYSYRNIKGVIFDCDGVLADTEQWNLKAWINTLHIYQVSFSYEEFLPFLGYPAKEVAKILKEKHPHLPENLSLLKDKHYFQITQNSLKPFPYILELLNLLKKNNIPYAVASSSVKEKLNYTLKETGLWDFFEIKISSSDITYGKPHPEIFLKAASSLNINPSSLLVVEDSLAGIEAALKASMNPLWFCRETHPHLKGMNIPQIQNIQQLVHEFEHHLTHKEA